MAGGVTGKPVVWGKKINFLSQMDHNTDPIPVS